MRCFVAVDLSAETRGAVAQAQATLRAASPRADVRWVAPEAFHLTLKFLGETEEDRVARVREALTTVARAHVPFGLAMAGLGAFPSLARPRVLWAGIVGGLREIGLLAADVERAALPLGFALDARPFGGHVTIGRVRSPRRIGRVLEAAARLAQQPLGSWTVREMVLYRSHLRPTGTVYEPLAALVLGRRK